VVLKDIDKALAVLGMQRLTRHAENILFMLSCNRDGYICIWKQCAVGVVHRNQHFAHVAGSIGYDSRRDARDVAVPGASGLGVPDDLYRLSDCKLAQLRLVEIGPHLYVS